MSHEHSQTPSARRAPLTIALCITVALVVVQLVGALLTSSLALFVDTAHIAADGVGLAIALLAVQLGRRPANDRHTWGLRRAEVLAALVQAVMLIAIGLVVIVEAIRRLWEPAAIPGVILLWFGGIGLVGNLISFVVLRAADSQNLNMRAAALEVGSDALGSLAVMAAAVIIWATGWGSADSIAALLIGALILPRAVAILRQAVSVLLESTPDGLNLEQVRSHMLQLPHVLAVHDLHASQVTSGLPVLTAHVILKDDCFRDGHSVEILHQLQQCVAEHFPVSIEHSTLQLEPASDRQDSSIWDH